MKTREQKDEERRQREAAWAAEDASLNAAASHDPGADDALARAEQSWKAGRAFFVLETLLGAMTLRPVTIDQAGTNDRPAQLLEAVEAIGWHLDHMSHYHVEGDNAARGTFVFRRER